MCPRVPDRRQRHWASRVRPRPRRRPCGRRLSPFAAKCALSLSAPSERRCSSWAPSSRVCCIADDAARLLWPHVPTRRPRSRRSRPPIPFSTQCGAHKSSRRSSRRGHDGPESALLFICSICLRALLSHYYPRPTLSASQTEVCVRITPLFFVVVVGFCLFSLNEPSPYSARPLRSCILRTHLRTSISPSCSTPKGLTRNFSLFSTAISLCPTSVPSRRCNPPAAAEVAALSAEVTAPLHSPLRRGHGPSSLPCPPRSRPLWQQSPNYPQCFCHVDSSSVR